MEESSLFSGKVPLLVFEGCIKEIPGDVALRGRFLEALDKFPQTEALSAAILASIERDFPDDPAAYVARAAHRSRADPGAAHSLLLSHGPFRLPLGSTSVQPNVLTHSAQSALQAGPLTHESAGAPAALEGTPQSVHRASVMQEACSVAM